MHEFFRHLRLIAVLFQTHHVGTSTAFRLQAINSQLPLTISPNKTFTTLSPTYQTPLHQSNHWIPTNISKFSISTSRYTLSQAPKCHPTTPPTPTPPTTHQQPNPPHLKTQTPSPRIKSSGSPDTTICRIWCSRMAWKCIMMRMCKKPRLFCRDSVNMIRGCGSRDRRSKIWGEDWW